MKNILLVIALSVVFCFAANQNAKAATLALDLTTAGADGYVGDAYFIQIDPQGTGIGSIEGFVEIGFKEEGGPTNNPIQAYNTRVNGVMNNGPSDTFNHELSLSSVPLVSLDGGGYYREFLLDINQQKNTKPSLLSLDEIQVFVSNTPNQSVDTFSASGILNLVNSTLVYRLDGVDTSNETVGADDNWIKLNYSLNAGSGSGDMFMYIPDNNFTAGFEYVYLYSKFGEQGGNFSNTDGQEEWAVREASAIPEPASLSLLGLGLLGLFGLGRKTRKE